MTDGPGRMVNHWWWRPGWRAGRRFYTWHLTFEGQPDVRRFVSAHRTGLAGVAGLDLVPDKWLHLTVQGVGFVDEVPEREVRAVVDAVRPRLRQLPAFDITFARMTVTPEAVESFAEPAELVRALRRTIRQGIADVWPQVPEPEDGFTPHVSVAYSSADGPASPVRAAVAQVNTPAATAHIGAAQLIVLNRDARMYEWAPFADAPLG